MPKPTPEHVAEAEHIWREWSGSTSADGPTMPDLIAQSLAVFGRKDGDEVGQIVEDVRASYAAEYGTATDAPWDDLFAAAEARGQAGLAAALDEVRRLASIVARRARGKRPKLPDDGYDGVLDESIKACEIVGIDIGGDYDYLGTLRRLVRERNTAQADRAVAVDAFHRCREERDAAVTERNELRALQAEQQRAFAEGLRVATKTARQDGAKAMRLALSELLIGLRVTVGALGDPDATMEDEVHDLWLTIDRIEALDPVTVAAEPAS